MPMNLVARGWAVMVSAYLTMKWFLNSDGESFQREVEAYTIVAETPEGRRYEYQASFDTLKAAEKKQSSLARAIRNGVDPSRCKAWDKIAARYGSEAYQADGDEQDQLYRELSEEYAESGDQRAYEQMTEAYYHAAGYSRIPD